MMQLPKIIHKKLSVRLSLMVVSSMALLLMVSLLVMLLVSRKAVKEEAMQNVTQTLDGTIQCIDNILLSVEQSTGNFYFFMITHLDDASIMDSCSYRLVETNPFIDGCAIAFKPGYMKGHDLYMTYYHREKENREHIVRSENFGNTPYTEQFWYTHPMERKIPGWLNPLKDVKVDIDPIFTYSLPIVDMNGEAVGVIGVDISLRLLSEIAEGVKPSPNSYCVLIDKDGSFIVHPDSKYLFKETALTLTDEEGYSSKEVAEAMMKGEAGYKPMHMEGTDFLIFYKPFERATVSVRAMEKLGWSAGILFPEDDIEGDYKVLFYYVLAIAIIGLLLLFFTVKALIRRQLKPLLMLSEKAQSIAQGHYNEVIPDSRQEDEIGRLQNNFQTMQQSLAKYIGKLEQLTATLREHGEHLRVTYNEVQKADRMKTVFLHNMTNQMTNPAVAIDRHVDELCDTSQHKGQKKTTQLVDNIQRNGETITELLNNLINISDEEIRKEVARD